MDLYEKYYTFALRFLSYRPRSVKEVRDRLEKKKASPEVIEKVIRSLLSSKFLDDAQFARSWVESRLRSRPKALSILKQELIQKGIQREIIEDILPDRCVTDNESIKKLVEKAERKYRNLDPKEQKQKIAAYLGRRGYSWDTISPAIDDYSSEEV